jgi:hypothetical protein
MHTLAGARLAASAMHGPPNGGIASSAVSGWLFQSNFTSFQTKEKIFGATAAEYWRSE